MATGFSCANCRLVVREGSTTGCGVKASFTTAVGLHSGTSCVADKVLCHVRALRAGQELDQIGARMRQTATKSADQSVKHHTKWGPMRGTGL